MRIKQVSDALEVFAHDCGDYPTESKGLKVLVEPTGRPCWNGPYVRQKNLFDAAGNWIAYQFPAKNSKSGFDLSTTGKDGRSNSADDVNNWDLEKQWRVHYEDDQTSRLGFVLLATGVLICVLVGVWKFAGDR